ncbi:RNA-binding (RRM/RBD/RNP motifs) family protein [Rhynchospora pubera]|uniref:RNA-binding (RRM/RBD/RNP motifs) family protein n=1 Tax=Rhynchospora pubera TaxID=906938 RepID=A0AAV8H116_9POAL|nr:RNA-binding (RRM/RBD/RNP motifs) family protein [Rhynchospora pubera]KAJ4811459.1 RNA-binding (RRM/RBD/RNP motifs) family protein [Rhynchospora pubera]
MSKNGFTRPKGTGESNSSPNLYVANCGPAVGLTHDAIKSAFQIFGEVIGVQSADDSGVRVIVCFAEDTAAQAAFQAWNEKSCPNLAGRVLHMRYSVPRPQKVNSNDSVVVSHSERELGIPGIHLMHEFITLEEEKELLKAVDERPWKSLAKRRVQHYGYEFLYEIRNVDSKQFLGELPSFVSHILQKIVSFPGLGDTSSKLVDQLTVNEYPCGVGLSPHIDTHSAFDDLIFSLSLAGSCIMEFRQYTEGSWNSPASSVVDAEELTKSAKPSNCTRKAVFLPPRSMLLMSGEGRYAWHHYIPHHKVDMIGDRSVRRGSRRVSFTFRKVRKGPCQCNYRQFCDSQLES